MWNVRHLGMILGVILIAATALAIEDDEEALPDATLSAEVPNGIVGLLEDVQDLRLKKREYLLEFEIKGRDSLRKKVEKVEEDQAIKIAEMDEELLSELKSYRRDIIKIDKKRMRLMEQRDRLDDDPEESAELQIQIDELEQEMERPKEILYVFEDILDDLKSMVKGTGSRTPSLMANAGADMPKIELQTVAGDPWDQEDATSKGNCLFIFWAHVNDSSIKAVEQIARVQQDLEEAKTQIYVVAVDTPPDEIKKVAEELPKSLIHLQITRDEAKRTHINLVPQVAFVLKGGEIHSMFLGYTTKLRAMIDDVLDDLAMHEEARSK